MSDRTSAETLDQMTEASESSPFVVPITSGDSSGKRQKTNSIRRRFEVNKMWDLHHKIVKQIALGQDDKNIAASLNTSETMVSSVRDSKICQKQIDQIKKDD